MRGVFEKYGKGGIYGVIHIAVSSFFPMFLGECGDRTWSMLFGVKLLARREKRPVRPNFALIQDARRLMSSSSSAAGHTYFLLSHIR